jgi:AraC family transcriptional regulator
MGAGGTLAQTVLGDDRGRRGGNWKRVSAACLSRFHFVRQFRKAAGMPPMRFVRETRLDAARTLLLTTDLPHREIARRVGFGNQCQLARVFRQLAGYSPSQLRRRSTPKRLNKVL